MLMLAVDSTTQRYTSGPQPEPDVWLIHTTEGMGWPGYNGGGHAPHDTIKAFPGKGIEVRRHYPYGQFSKALANTSVPGETNLRGVIQTELLGTCDPRYKDNPNWFYWPDADDVVLQALADYYRPILDLYDIPLQSVPFLAYPASYGSRSGQRMSPRQFASFQGICGHQHAPENDHGDPGNFPIAKLLEMLGGDPKHIVTVKQTSGGSSSGTTYWTPTGSRTTRQIQKIVKVKVDGFYGDDTKAAVKKLQAKLGVTADGYWGPATDKAYGMPKKPAATSVPASKAPKFPLPSGHWYGVESSDPRNHSGFYAHDKTGIRVWQERMLARGWAGIGEADGVFGPKSQKVAKQFQAQKKLKVDGAVGAETWKAAWTKDVT